VPSGDLESYIFLGDVNVTRDSDSDVQGPHEYRLVDKVNCCPFCLTTMCSMLFEKKDI